VKGLDMARTTRRGVLLLAVLLPIVFTTGFLLFRDIDEGRRAKRMAKILASFIHALDTEINEAAYRLEPLVKEDDPAGWRLLDDAEYRWLVEEVVRQNNIPPSWMDMVMADAWGRPLRAEVRRPRGVVEFRISSAGPDRQFRTPDDLERVTSQATPAPTTAPA
jgi:hypothetical protein